MTASETSDRSVPGAVSHGPKRRSLAISERSQIYILWWALIFAAIYGIALGFLLHMIPPPDATDSAAEIKRWYQDEDTEIKIGATIASWTSAFMLPFWAVIAIQISRQEKGRPIWAVMAMAGGTMLSIFLVLPPIFFGVAAYTPDRGAEITAMMHELGVLTLVTTDQYYIFAWVAIIVVCLLPQRAPHSPFPRWFGFFNAWFATVVEAGAIAFNTRTGPFSWNGLFVFWSPFGLFAIWILMMSALLLRALHAQVRDAEAAETAQTVEARPA